MYKTSNLPNTRIDVADALRGIAVAGIILYHSVEHFDIFTQEPITHTLASDQLVADVLAWLLSGKMYGIFAMLFGLSFFIMNDNQQQKGKNFSLRFAWRMCLLFGFVRLVAYSDQLFAVEVGVVHHRPAGHPARRTLLSSDWHDARPQYFMGNIWQGHQYTRAWYILGEHPHQPTIWI